ncbi:hypothetical protein AB0J83_28260 [Actinoplanes sp. NPDC049596]|uniref:hypothetical protein n=1 Tax=unclassified Actinoplanes TaxID=2626549 RepID=UPI00343DC028
MAVQNLLQQDAQLVTFLGIKGDEQFILYVVGQRLQIVQVPQAGRGGGDDVAPPVGRVDAPFEVTVA